MTQRSGRFLHYCAWVFAIVALLGLVHAAVTMSWSVAAICLAIYLPAGIWFYMAGVRSSLPEIDEVASGWKSVALLVVLCVVAGVVLPIFVPEVERYAGVGVAGICVMQAGYFLGVSRRRGNSA